MKPRLLELLVCPGCAGPFEVDSFDRAGQTDEVVEGILRCPCGRTYPIVDTIPRIIDSPFTLFPEFSRRYADRLPPVVPAIKATDPNAGAIRNTRDSFGYQWTVFSEMVIDFRENFLSYIHPLDESFFPGKVGFDVGCGFGRHIYNAATFGAEMVGVDISAAIDATRQNTRHLPNVHLVQADLYRLPFREGSFDFVYSIGVLPHL
ncbi:MAG: methyltransferase domain-containing protein, partial [Dehalococcoidia bacterium]